MREIRFRGKTFTNEWRYGTLATLKDWEDDNDKAIIIKSYGRFNDGSASPLFREWDFVDKNTVGQFTGLCDSNGKEIYEGDILMCIGQRKDNKGRKYFRKVSFKNGSFCMSVPEYNIDSYLYNHIVNGKLNWEVIGNIYDNKELLEGTK